MDLSNDQKQALDKIMSWYRDPDKKQYLSVGGYAGTGKTTLIAILRANLNQENKKLKVGFASYTGKAARVLRTKLIENDVIYPIDFVGTIHSLIYSPILNTRQEIIGWQPKEKIERDLIIIDEASMVDDLIWQHLIDYKVPILAVGDHGQLPPIRGSFNLMQKPDLVLTQIHRQAKLNPIIDVSVQARKRGMIEIQRYSDLVQKFSMNSTENKEILDSMLTSYNTDTLVICGYNHTRIKLNNHIRAALGIETAEPVYNDRVICLRNNYEKNIFNGMLGTIINIRRKNDDWYEAEIEMDGEDEAYNGLIAVTQFNSNTALNYGDKRLSLIKGDLFDFGYALTVHKAQGSQAQRVILLEERFSKMSDEEWRRWLYTAVTRAVEELYIFG